MNLQIVAYGEVVIISSGGSVRIEPGNIVWEGEHIDIALALRDWLQDWTKAQFVIREIPEEPEHKCPV